MPKKIMAIVMFILSGVLGWQYSASAAEPLRFENQSYELEVGILGGTFVNVKGGVPPYSVTASNSNVTINRGKLSSSFRIVAAQIGSADLLVKDKAGATASARIKVVGKNADLKAVLSDSVMDVGKVVNLTVTGGTPPYRADFTQPVRYKVERLGEGSYRLTGLVSGGGNILVYDSKGRSTGASLKAAPLVMSAARTSLTVGDETVLEIKGGTSPIQFDTRQASMLMMGKVSGNKYRVIATAPGNPVIQAQDGQYQRAYVQFRIAPKPVPISSQPLMLDISPNKIHSDPRAVHPSFATLTVRNGKGPFTVNGGAKLSVSPVGSSQFKVSGKGQAGMNNLISVTDSEGRKGQVYLHLVQPLSGDCRTAPIKVGRAAIFRITSGERNFKVTGGDPRIVRVSQSPAGGFSAHRPGDPIETVTVVGVAPGNVIISISDLNNFFYMRCPVTVIP